MLAFKRYLITTKDSFGHDEITCVLSLTIEYIYALFVQQKMWYRHREDISVVRFILRNFTVNKYLPFTNISLTWKIEAMHILKDAIW